MTPHITKPEDVEVHETGWIVLPKANVEITRLPAMDAHHPTMAARVGHGIVYPGVALPTTLELDELHTPSCPIEPVTFPDAALLAELREQLGRGPKAALSEDEINRFRTANMRSFEWCEAHDEECWRRLEAADWDGEQPVVGFGKHWTKGGGIYGWWRKGQKMIQSLSYFHQKEPSYTDYATNVHFVRPIGSYAGPPIRRRILVPVVDAIGAVGSVLADAVDLAARAVGIRDTDPAPAPTMTPPQGTPAMSMQIQRQTIRKGSTGPDVEAWQRIIGAPVDGKFGAGTQHLTEFWQQKHGLVADGVVGPKSWAKAGEQPSEVPTGSLEPWPAKRTPITAAQLELALAHAWPTVIGGTPKRESLLVLVAQSAIETGDWKSLWNFNIGNAKRVAGQPWMMLHNVWEILNGKKVIFDPPHPQTHFRAFDSLDDGAAAYLEMMHGRFAKSWHAVEAGEPEAFAHALKAQRYFTADANDYARALRLRFDRFAKA